MCNAPPGTLCRIIPPHMLDSMMKSPTKKVRDAAIANIKAAERARASRATLAELRPRLVPTLALDRSTRKNRIIHDARKRNNLNGTVRRREGESNTGDREVDEAYRFTGYVHDYYRKIHERNSIDNSGMVLKSSVRFREDSTVPYNNAFWWNNQMAFGDGDGIVFKRFTASLDVIGHELSHGVVEHTANLVYANEPGALNESFSDIFGSLIKQWKKGQTARQADWLIGDDLVVQTPTRTALRSLAEPGTAYVNDPDLGTDPQPWHMDDKYTGQLDNGGVHINSGIPNHAFYVAAIAAGGCAWETVGHVWYDALCRLMPTSDFEECVIQTYMSAGFIFGDGSRVQKAVAAGWDEVGFQIN